MTKEEYHRVKSVVSPTFPPYTGAVGQAQPETNRCDDECIDFRNPYRNIEEVSVVGADGHLSPGAEYAGERTKSPTASNAAAPGPSTPPKGANDIQVGGDHYKEHDLKCPNCGHRIQHWDISWALAWDQFQYCITKYVFRWKFKNGLQDLRKANHHLQKYIEVLEAREKERGDPAPRS